MYPIDTFSKGSTAASGALKGQKESIPVHLANYSQTVSNKMSTQRQSEKSFVLKNDSRFLSTDHNS